MRVRPLRLALLLVSLLAGPAVLAAAPAARAAGPAPGSAPAASAGAKAAKGRAARTGARAAHPDAGGEQECATCHATGTPAAFQAWHDSRHGLALVKCVVCHGSTGADFVRRPPPERCIGCHAEKVESAARGPVRDCFACHAPHTLAANPHRR